MNKGQLKEHHLNSALLRNNPLKNPNRRNLLIFEPHQYQKNEKLPCLLYLPGFGSYPEKWSQKDFPGYKLADYLMLSEQIPRFLLVCIDGSSRFGGSQYVNSDLNGPFEDHIVQEICPYLEKHHPGISDFYIAGHSSGGFGALHLSSLHPKLFSKTASFAGDLHFELTHKNMLVDFANKMRDQKLGLNLKDSLKNETTDYVLGLSAAYSSNLSDKKWKMDFPIDIESGLIKDDIWKKWMALDPLTWVKKRKSNLKKLKCIYLSAGDRDQFGLHLGAQAFSKVCESQNIKTNLEFHSGNHSLLLQQFQKGLEVLLT